MKIHRWIQFYSSRYGRNRACRGALINCGCSGARAFSVFRQLSGLTSIVLFFALNISSAAGAVDTYPPYADRDYPANVYFGDTHVHTNLSMDSYFFGNRNLGPEEAYRFAKGETVKTDNGINAKLDRPLDFLVVADHAFSLGSVNAVLDKNPELMKNERGQRWASLLAGAAALRGTDSEAADRLIAKVRTDAWDNGPVGGRSFQSKVWPTIAALADKHNAPGYFTAFIGYEWTPPFNLHRVVIYRDGSQKAGQLAPFSKYDNSDPQALWEFMAEYERRTGGSVLAIPHNSNQTSGVMFAPQDAKGNPLSKQYATARSRWEPLLEVTQIKGDSETLPLLSPTDEFADYETVTAAYYNPEGLALARNRGYRDYEKWHDEQRRTQKNSDWMRPYEYARSALKLGLGHQANLGVNPFKFGMIGSTDSHTGLATSDEGNFWGKAPAMEPRKGRVMEPWWPGGEKQPPFTNGWRMSASGYAAVWAEENTRESLFAAMKRKEVYATTGPRMTVRFFGGWDYLSEDAFKPNLAQIGYNKGVPMGGDLTHGPQGKSPKFLIHTVKDPDGANLDRVQVIKGWRDANGELHEKIYNVALSDHRKVDRRGRVKPVGNTVNIPDAGYTNTIGDPELAVVWADPDFDKNELAFYYLRVLEIPTPRWTAYDARYFGLRDLPEEIPMVTQERAYTSPIWYSPAPQDD